MCYVQFATFLRCVQEASGLRQNHGEMQIGPLCDKVRKIAWRFYSRWADTKSEYIKKHCAVLQ